MWTVGKATQGLADYLDASVAEPSAIIARDSRRGGEAFVRRTAEVLAANGVTAYVFDGVASTPELTFAVRELRCSAGVCVTASHNPAEYNGYKVYDADGCQITTEAARGIQARIDAADVFDGVSRTGYRDAVARGLVREVGHGVRGRYLAEVEAQLEGVDCSGLSVAYTPLNGTGGLYVPTLLTHMGVEAHVVPAQAAPDGGFPTCPRPNPEVPEAMEMVTELARERGCDLALATDPDADRLGVAVPHGGAWRQLTGNEVGELLMDWLLSRGLATLGWTVSRGPTEGGSMADPKHPRHFTDDFKRQIVSLYNAGKPPSEIMREYDLGSTTLRRWINSINATGSPHAADNRTPEQDRIIELERENKRLRMEVDVLKQAALIFARK